MNTYLALEIGNENMATAAKAAIISTENIHTVSGTLRAQIITLKAKSSMSACERLSCREQTDLVIMPDTAENRVRIAWRLKELKRMHLLQDGWVRAAGKSAA